MAILPVSSVSFKSNNISFKGSDNKETEMVSTPIISETPKTIPVMVLMALSPSLLNGAVPKTMEENPNAPKVVMVEDIPEQEISETTYVMSPELQGTQQSSAPFGWRSLNFFDIRKVISGKTQLYNFDMVFATSKNAGINDSEITDVFLLQRGKTPAKSKYINPPKIEEVVYHNTGDGKEFYGVKLYQTILRDGEKVGAMRNEVRIDNNSAMELLKLLNNKTQWENSTRIPITETYTAERMKTIDY